jgi:hypothetical protein
MSRRSLPVLVAVYAAIALAAGLVLSPFAALVVAFLSVLVLAIGFGALLGGDWLRDVSARRFRDDGRR